MDELFTDIRVVPCKICGDEPKVATGSCHTYCNDESFCDIMCHRCGICVSDTGSDEAEAETHTIGTWNRIMGTCESCKYYDLELPICHKRPYENNVGEGSCCSFYEVRQ